nr:DUF2382 domain-containing protein [uncultured Pseudokineococcus sp.]
MTLSQEQAVSRLVRVPVERVRTARRVRTRTVRVEVDVEVRHEELVVTREPLPAEGTHHLGSTTTQVEPAADREVVLVLGGEVPVVGVQSHPAEQVTVRTQRVDGTRRLDVDLAREVVEIDQSPTA